MSTPGGITTLPSLTAWNDIPGLQNGFLGRSGGVSTGPFASLNLSLRVSDDAGDVQTNWQRVSAALGGGGEFVRIRQVHGDTIVRAEDVDGDEPEADALITCAPGLRLAILTADCVPLLLVDPRTGAIAAVHAGWRGTLAGIGARVVHEMGAVFGSKAADLRVALGPSIASCCYEVSAEIADEIEGRWGKMAEAVKRSPEARPRVDLRSVNAQQLRSVGVQSIAAVGPCTRCASASYFSHRQATQPQGEGTTGRQLSFIGWRRPPE